MRRAFNWVLWIVLGPVIALLVVGLAWLAFNGPWADAPERPVPAALEPAPESLAPQDNAFFDAEGLTAPADEPPNAWGQRAWRSEPGDGKASLPLPSGPAWQCQPAREDCMARWRAEAAALRVQMAAARVFGDRCTALASRPQFEEPLRPMPADGSSPWTAPVPAWRPVSTCLQWLQIEAALAPDLAQAQQAWSQADALMRLIAGGVRTLISQNVAWALAERQQLLLAQWASTQVQPDALRDAWLAPLPASLLQPRTWMVSEARYVRASVLSMARPVQESEPQGMRWFTALFQLGYQPQRTVQAADDDWLADLAAFGARQGADLVQAVQALKPVEVSGLWGLRWRNTVGQVSLDVARPARLHYLLRQADAALAQAALRAVQALNTLPAHERAARWPALVPDAALRERMQLEGDALLVRPWQPKDGRDTLRFPLRPA
jgi:hypothetical protein